MAKRKQPTHETFEAAAAHGKFTKVADSMMDSQAWLSLSLSQMGLYLLLKRKYTKYKAGDDNRKNISFPRSEYSQFYSNNRTFWRDLDALIEAGFIEVISNGKNTRTPTIYGFCDAWKDYGTPGFEIHPSQRRAAAPQRKTVFE